jgi:hypothetical protein
MSNVFQHTTKSVKIFEIYPDNEVLIFYRVHWCCKEGYNSFRIAIEMARGEGPYQLFYVQFETLVEWPSLDNSMLYIEKVKEESLQDSYELIIHEKYNGIKCKTCSFISYNANDIKHKWCEHCKKFHYRFSDGPIIY